jgi:predicted dienelactone hydrolase
MKTGRIRLLALAILAVASIEVVQGQPEITDQPMSQTNLAGSAVTLEVGATGTLPLFYRWRRATALVAGETNATLVIVSLQNSTPTVSEAFGPEVGDKATNLASHGYVVVAIDHPDCAMSVFPDGQIVRGSAPFPIPGGWENPWRSNRVADVQFVFGELQRWNDSDPLLAGRLDANRAAVQIVE